MLVRLSRDVGGSRWIMDLLIGIDARGLVHHPYARSVYLYIPIELSHILLLMCR